MEHLTDAVGLAPRRRRQELPYTVACAGSPGPMGDEAAVEESLQREIDLVSAHGEREGHAVAAEERRATPIGGEGEQHEHRRRVRSDLGKPAVVQELGLEPAEGATWPALEVGPWRYGRRPAAVHVARREACLRSFALRSARSIASFWR